jgi:5S rRNA maturation endonuclease (ribonuclease M5)
MEMSNSLERRLEETRRLLDNLAASMARGTPVIVEGKKDARALKELEVTGDIIYAKTSGKTFLDVLGEVEKRDKSEVILLMDFDRRGKRWTRRLARHLERMKIKPNLVFWRRLLSLVGGDVRDIEGLSAYLRTLETKTGKNILDMDE